MATSMIRRRRLTGLLFLLILSCQQNSDKDDGIPHSDSGSDSETESDSDSKVDTDTSTGTDSDTGTIIDGGIDTDTESDADTETDGECDDIDWGVQCTVGEKVANWYFNGFILPLLMDNEITLETIRCPGYRTLVVVAGDTTCDDCLPWVTEIANVDDQISNANSVILTVWTDSGQSYPNSDALSAVDQGDWVPDFSTGDATAIPNDCNPEKMLPFSAVIDLRNGYLLGKDEEQGEKLTIAEILDLVERANN